MKFIKVMKKLKFYALLMPLTLGLASLAACSSDDYNNNGEIQESGDVTLFDQVQYLQNNIIEIDSLGNIVQRISGVKMNDADSTELTVGVKDINAAKEMFESWLSPDTKTKAISPSTVDMEADLADANGKVKETVYFKAATGNSNEIAEMTFKNGGVLKHFSKVRFIGPNLHSLNSYSPYTVGDFEQHDTYDEGMQNWVCIRDAKDGVSGLLMYISSRIASRGMSDVDYFATPSLARAASELMRNNNNWDTYVELFKESGHDYLNAGEYYWIGDWKNYFFSKSIYAIRLSDGDIDWFEIVWKNPKKRYIQIRAFGLAN